MLVVIIGGSGGPDRFGSAVVGDFVKGDFTGPFAGSVRRSTRQPPPALCSCCALELRMDQPLWNLQLISSICGDSCICFSESERINLSMCLPNRVKLPEADENNPASDFFGMISPPNEREKWG